MCSLGLPFTNGQTCSDMNRLPRLGVAFARDYSFPLRDDLVEGFLFFIGPVDHLELLARRDERRAYG